MVLWSLARLPKSPKYRYLLFLIISMIMIITGYYGYSFWRYAHQPMLADGQPATVFIFRPGTSVRQLALQLQQQPVKIYPRKFVFLAGLKGKIKSLKAGEYAIDQTTTPSQLLENLALARVVQHRFTIVEGWTFQQLRQALDQALSLKHSLQGLNDAAVMQQLGYPNQHPEGQFYPDTYQFILGMTDKAILQRAYQRMQTQLQRAWQQRSSGLDYQTPYQALIVASLVEKESALSKERQIIAGVILARLKRNMRLQIDPTVIYGLQQNYTGKLTKNDLRRDTPYNTYLHKGLPPTPIAMPGLTSIQAALQPELTSYLYFVSKGDGSHYFSETLSEQNQAIKKYLSQINKEAP